MVLMFSRGISITLIITILLSVSCVDSLNRNPEIVSLTADTNVVKPIVSPVLIYGISIDSFYTVTDQIKPNGILSDILLKNGVSMQEIDQAIRNSRDVFDVRTIKAGNNYILFCEPDSIARVKYLVYEHSRTNFYVFSFNDSLNITPYTKEIKKEIRYASGIIKTSLWETIIEEGLPKSLALDLSDIFAWTVDFFGLQTGDSFKVIYEELFVDNMSLGSSRIYCAQFNRTGSSVTAIPYIQNGKETFFDLDGSSLRKAFLKAPLHFSRISSRYSSSRMHPILRIRRPHFGVDYAAPIGTPVQAIGDGKVISAKTENGSGKMLKIQHNSIYSTAYLHLSRYGDGIKQGVYVNQGQIIGYVGTSGLSTGPHLDFRFYKNGSPVDPLKVDSPPVEPVLEENLEKFEKIKLVVLSLLGTFN